MRRELAQKAQQCAGSDCPGSKNFLLDSRNDLGADAALLDRFVDNDRRLVFLTDAAMVSMSNGEVLRGSMTSAAMPSLSN